MKVGKSFFCFGGSLEHETSLIACWQVSKRLPWYAIWHTSWPDYSSPEDSWGIDTFVSKKDLTCGSEHWIWISMLLKSVGMWTVCFNEAFILSSDFFWPWVWTSWHIR
jgi:hypothetical protein